MTTSASTSPSNAGHVCSASAASASRSHQLRCSPGRSAGPVMLRRAMGSGNGTHKECPLSCARLKAVAPSNVGALLELGAHHHPPLVVPDPPSLTYARLRGLTDEAPNAPASGGG